MDNETIKAIFKDSTAKALSRGVSVETIIRKDLDCVVKAFLKFKREYNKWMTTPRIENPRKFADKMFNKWWDEEHSENSSNIMCMKREKAKFEGIREAILEWLSVYGLDEMNEKEIKRTLKKIETRKAKMTC
jgi:hypothetical protein